MLFLKLCFLPFRNLFKIRQGTNCELIWTKGPVDYTGIPKLKLAKTSVNLRESIVTKVTHLARVQQTLTIAIKITPLRNNFFGLLALIAEYSETLRSNDSPKISILNNYKFSQSVIIHYACKSSL